MVGLACLFLGSSKQKQSKSKTSERTDDMKIIAVAFGIFFLLFWIRNSLSSLEEDFLKFLREGVTAVDPSGQGLPLEDLEVAVW